jgi:hypothetical protein
LSPVLHTGRSEGRSWSVSLDLELLKPLRVAAVASERLEHAEAPDTVWLEYPYHKKDQVFLYLPTKLAEWIGKNMQEELEFQIGRTSTSRVYPS